jgi:hypothetical protein
MTTVAINFSEPLERGEWLALSLAIKMLAFSTSLFLFTGGVAQLVEHVKPGPYATSPQDAG